MENSCSDHKTARLLGAFRHPAATRALVIREDRLLLTDLARLNTDVVPMAMRIMDESATVEEHYAFAERLAAMAQRLQDRGAHMGFVIDGQVAVSTNEHMNGSVSMLHHRDL